MFRMLLKMFILWKSDFPIIMLKERKEKYLQQGFSKKKILRAWLKCLEQKKKEQKNLIKSDVIYKIILTKRYFQKLHNHKKWKQQLRLYGKCLFEKNRETLLANSLRKWQILFKINRNQRISENEKIMAFMSNCFYSLKKNYVTQKLRKIHLMSMEKYLHHKIKNKIYGCLISWKNITRKKSRTQNVQLLLKFYQ